MMQSIRFLCPRPQSFSEKGLELLSNSVCLEKKNLNQDDFEKAVTDYDGIIIRYDTRIPKSVLGKGSRLKYIICPTTGLDHICLDALDSSMHLYSLKGETEFLKSIDATAEHTVLLMLSVLRSIPVAFEGAQRQIWTPSLYRGYEAKGKRLGLVGYGRLGTKVAFIAKALGMHVSIFDPHVLEAIPSDYDQINTLQELLSNSDIVTLHVPLNSETRGLIGPSEIELMKQNSYLINTSRGEVVDAEALLKALKANKLSGAALDVIPDEARIISEKGFKSELVRYSLENPKLIITPHIGGATFESVEATDLFVISKFLRDYKNDFVNC